MAGSPPSPKSESKRRRAGAGGGAVARLVLSLMVCFGSGTLCAFLAARQHMAPEAVAAMTALALLVSGLFAAPWRVLREIATLWRDLRSMTTQLERIDPDDEEREALSSLPLERNDELGDLARVIRRVIAGAIGRRIEASVVKNQMHDNIARRTRLATAQLQREITTDPLTGLGNRRRLEQVGTACFAQAGRNAAMVSAVMIDMDRFKGINDRLGHDVGDECLRGMGELLRSALRPEDVPVRLGGDEFVVLLPESSPEQAALVGQRILTLFRQQPWNHHDVPAPDLSIGIACLVPDGRVGLDELLRCADEALYQSKRGGRGRVTMHERPRTAA